MGMNEWESCALECVWWSREECGSMKDERTERRGEESGGVEGDL